MEEEKTVSEQEKNRKNLQSRRLFWVLIGFNIVLFIYLILEIIMLITK